MQRKYPDLVTLQTLGKSFQGRPMVLAKISADPNAGNPIIFVDAGVLPIMLHHHTRYLAVSYRLKEGNEKYLIM